MLLSTVITAKVKSNYHECNSKTTNQHSKSVLDEKNFSFTDIGFEKPVAVHLWSATDVGSGYVWFL